jgi:outer membrane protein assembly factor BamB
MHRRLAATWWLAAALLGGCASDKPKPTPLESVTPQIAGRQVWSASVGALPFTLMPTARGDAFVVAGGDGTVLAVDTGRERWNGSAGAGLSAGVGSDGRYTAVVTRDNELVVLDGGSVKWRTRLGSLVATAPLVAGERVFVMGVDRVVQAYDAQDGRYLWVLRRGGEPLTSVRGSA